MGDALSQHLGMMTYLKDLNLGFMNIQDSEGPALAAATGKLIALTSLDVTGNHLNAGFVNTLSSKAVHLAVLNLLLRLEPVR